MNLPTFINTMNGIRPLVSAGGNGCVIQVFNPGSHGTCTFRFDTRGDDCRYVDTVTLCAELLEDGRIRIRAHEIRQILPHVKNPVELIPIIGLLQDAGNIYIPASDIPVLTRRSNSAQQTISGIVVEFRMN